ncbi:MAG: peptidase [Gammaproteobacteria bacterium HGW-Gammaproteobacteria-8]|nr:MAG: peptidase [Gammaproteobacteria bacterium HGW-Gammaproteobacteria-8]
MNRLLIALLALPALLQAQPSALLPGFDYDPAAPSFEQVLGHAPGAQISSPEQLRQWFEALAAHYPDRVRIVPYATSWQGRELFYAIIGSAARIAELDAIRADIQAIARPQRHATARVEQALQRVPATVWIAASVHGNEISPADAAMLAAWHLLAARDDELAQRAEADALVFINPLQNPDGRARFLHHFEAGLGLEPAASRLAAEHDEPWPSGRVNHYLFDLNRDWLAMTQPETRGHVSALLDWFPLVFVDAHEMGSDSSFFFAPEAVPYNPLLAGGQRDSLALFGANNVRWFDRYGYQYFTREVFDAFYPGYGASWPSYYGAVAMTYEQGSARGLVMRLANGETMHYADTVAEYLAAMLATIETATAQRERLWRDFAAYRREGSAAAGSDDPRGWAIPAQTDQGGADHLATLLARHGAEVFRLESERRSCGVSLAAGSYLVPGDQPDYRKLRVLLDRDVQMDANFIAEQERRRAKGLPDEIYDVTAWSLPLMFNIDTVECARVPEVDGLVAVAPDAPPPGRVERPDARVAFIAPGGSRATLRLLAAALQRELVVQSAEQGFTLEGREFPSGSLIFARGSNPDSLLAQLRELAGQTGAVLYGVDSSQVSQGPDFGSGKVRRLIQPRIALAWDAPGDVNSAGALRFIIERQFGYPVVPIRSATLAAADLNRFDVIVLADQSGRRDGSLAATLGSSGRDNLAEWVGNGGVLVTLAGATEWAAHPEVDLLATRVEYAARSDDAASGEANGEPEPARVTGTVLESAQDLAAAVEPEQTAPDSVAGALLRAVVDPDHWLSQGVADELAVLVRGNRIFRPLTLDQGSTVARFVDAEGVAASGHLWDENRRQLAFKPFVMVQPHERGMVIGFSEDPAVRAYLDGLNALLINALLVAPSYSGKLR